MWNVSVRRGAQKKAQAVCHRLYPCLDDFYLFVLLSLYWAMLDLAAPAADLPCSTVDLEFPPRPVLGSTSRFWPHGVRAAAQAWGTALLGSAPSTWNHILELLQPHKRNAKQIQQAAASQAAVFKDKEFNECLAA